MGNSNKGMSNPNNKKKSKKQIKIENAEKQRLNSELISAAKAGDAEKVRSLLGSGVNANATGGVYPNYRSAIHEAAENGHVGVVQILLDAGADVNAKGGVYLHRWCAIHKAAENGHADVVQILLDAGASVNAKDDDGRTPTYYAYSNDHLAVVRIFLERGCVEVNVNGLIYCAAANGNADFVRLLMEKGAYVNASFAKPPSYVPKTPIVTAVEKGHRDVSKLLFIAGATLPYNTKLPLGAKPEDFGIVGARFDYDGRLLQDYRQQQNVNAAQNRGSHGAKKGNNNRVVNNTNNNNNQPQRAIINAELNAEFILVAKEGDAEGVHSLLGRGAEVNALDGNGYTALHGAAESGHAGIIQILIDNRANANIKGRDDWTPLHAAALNNKVDAIRTLRGNGADANAKDSYGWTPIYSAACMGHTAAINMLANNGADVNEKNQYGWAPICSAAYNGHADSVKALVERGADVNVSNGNGKTAMSCARGAQRLEICKTLLIAGARLPAGAKAEEFGYTANDFSQYGRLLASFQQPQNGNVLPNNAPLVHNNGHIVGNNNNAPEVPQHLEVLGEEPARHADRFAHRRNSVDAIIAQRENPAAEKIEEPETFEDYLRSTSINKFDYICPIGGEAIVDAVMTVNGSLYERENIANWLADHNTDPKTNTVLESNILVPCRAIKEEIENLQRQFDNRNGAREI
jgi:ankyrin repeat protein